MTEAEFREFSNFIDGPWRAPRPWRAVRRGDDVAVVALDPHGDVELRRFPADTPLDEAMADVRRMGGNP